MSTDIRVSDKTDLTEGPVVKKILIFALPVMASNLLLQLYNAVDSIVIGQYAGSEALAAVGVSNPIMMLLHIARYGRFKMAPHCPFHFLCHQHCAGCLVRVWVRMEDSRCRLGDSHRANAVWICASLADSQIRTWT